VYVTGWTTSTDFPVTARAPQQQSGGGTDAFLTVVAVNRYPPGPILFSTYIGGSGVDIGYAVALDSNHGAYVGGYTSSPDLVSSLSAKATAASSTFVVEYAASTFDDSTPPPILYQPIFETYLAAYSQDARVALGLRSGPSGDEPYLAGTAVPGTLSNPSLGYGGGPSDAFIAKFTYADLSLAFGNPTAIPGGAAAPSILPGGAVFIPITIKNLGPQLGENARLTVDLPAGVTVVALNGLTAWAVSGNQLVAALGTLIVGQQLNLTLVAQTDPALAGTTIQLQGTLRSDIADPAPGSNVQPTAFAIAGGGQFTFTVAPPDGIDFGSVPVGQIPAPTRDITVKALQLVDLRWSIAAGAGGNLNGLQLKNPNETTATISDSKTITIAFSPAASGNGSATLFIDDRVSYAKSVTVKGVGEGQALPSITSVEDGAGFQPVIASNAWVTLKGDNLIPPNISTRIWQDKDFVNGQMPTALDGVSVTINGMPAWVYYIDAKQINVLAPRDATLGQVNVTLTAPNGQATATAMKEAIAPGVFMTLYQGVLYGVATMGSTVVGSPASPAHRGQRITLYLSGLGDTTPLYPNGIAVNGLVNLNAMPAVQIGGSAAAVEYAGMVPGAAGLYQLNIIVGQNTPLGDQPLTVSLLNRSSQPGVLLTIAQ
jgi:uncharacterized protein (TIGR03437 family)